MDKVIVIVVGPVVAVPIVSVGNCPAAIPSSAARTGAGSKVRATRRTAETATAKVPTCYVGPGAKVTTTHATAEMSTTHTTATKTSSTVSSLRLVNGGGYKKQSAREGGRDKNHARSHDTSPLGPLSVARPPMQH